VNRMALVFFLVCCIGCGPAAEDRAEPVHPETATTSTVETPPDAVDSNEPPSPIRFETVTDSGLGFIYYGNPGPRHHMIEQNGGGVALFDFDQDGWCDAFLANGSDFDRPAEQHGAVHCLSRNVTAKNGPIRFQQVSALSGLAVSGFGMGVAGGDYDNDGFPDLVICGYGLLQLWHNEGDGTFSQVTTAAGINGSAWSAGAAFADLDDDGDLDLYVTNYVEYSPQDAPCFTQHQPPVQISCGPIGRVAQPDTLWENTGAGTFADVSEASGIRAVDPGKGLAVEIADLNQDRRLDVYVAGDTSPNLLFLNRGRMTFEEDGLLQGVAVSSDGGAGSSMGIACADFDGNGWFDLFVTNFENAINDYYDHVSESAYLHRSNDLGLDAPSRPMLAFGTVGADFDLDQWPDLFVTNGHIWDLTSLGFGHQYAMPPQLFRNDNGKRFQDVSRQSGGYFEELWLGRAAAMSDLDRDGRSDLLVTHLLRPAAVIRNVSPPAGRSLQLRLIGRRAARSPLGITVQYRCAGRSFVTHLPSGGSFAASHDPDILLPVGSATHLDELTIHWSQHHSETRRDLSVADPLIVIESDGDGIAP